MRTSHLAFALGIELAIFAVTDASPKIVGAAVLGSRIICVNDNGTISTWSFDKRALDGELSREMSARSISLIASNDSILWAISRTTLLQWSGNESRWVEHSTLLAEKEVAIELLSLGSEPVVVYPRKVVRPWASREYLVPKLGGQLSTDRLRVLAHYVAAPNIWFGTGQGEWGGHLVGLNTDTGAWSFYYDALHYVTGITQLDSGEVIVAWSMSHMGWSDAILRIHDQNTNLKEEFADQGLKYFQSLIYEPIQKRLYAIEQNNIVELRQGVPHFIADLGKLHYEAEPHAVGVAPGILCLFTLPDSSLLIIHRSAPPFLLTKGKLLRFREVNR